MSNQFRNFVSFVPFCLIGFVGYTFDDSVEMIGNEIGQAARWKSGTDIGSLAGRTVRLHFKMKDVDLFAIQFADKK